MLIHFSKFTASFLGLGYLPWMPGTWGTIVAIAIFDALTTGNMIAWADLTASKTIATGDILRIPAGDLDVTLS